MSIASTYSKVFNLKERDNVAGHGLCAAASELDVEEGAPPVSELLVYSKVVEELDRLQAVVSKSLRKRRVCHHGNAHQ